MEDAHGFTWFATGSGINRYDGYRIKPYVPPTDDLSQLERLKWRPLKLIIDTLDNFYLASDFAGLQIYNAQKQKLFHLDHSNSDLSSDLIFEMSQSPEGIIWLATGDGVNSFEIQNQKITRLDSVSGNVFRIITGTDGKIWFISEEQGLCNYDGRSVHQVKSLLPKTVDAIFPLASDQLLIAIENIIYSYNPAADTLAYFFSIAEQMRISEVLVDLRNNLWAGTYNHGLFHFNPTTRYTYHFRHQTDHREFHRRFISLLTRR